MLNKIQQILKTCGRQNSVLPATELYNEGWMLRLVLYWFAKHRDNNDHPLSFGLHSRWFSEALIPPPFLPTSRGDSLSETWTHADAVIGDFVIGEDDKNKGGVSLLPEAKHFMVIEAKMFSKLSAGITHDPNYDQATRNVACIAELLNRQPLSANCFSKLGFYVLAPKKQIEMEPSFKSKTKKESIREKVEKRVQSYIGRDDYEEKQEWFVEAFLPMLEIIDIQCLSWEDVIDYIKSKDSADGEELSEFYHNCLKYNKFVACKW